jgi:NAD(P)-dependent dehydrogenase (short-subunit alcohol dehydrogenase family)
VTGAASGIGRACANTLVEDGCARVVLADLNENGLAEVARELEVIESKVETLVFVGDMSSEADVDRMVDEAVAKFGAIHYCINSAGVTSKPRTRTHELGTEAFDRVLNINLRGVWLCERAQIRQFLKQEPTLKTRRRGGGQLQRGSIVNISSILGYTAHPTAGAYPAAKAGVLGITRTDAVAYGTDGIRINAICPGFIDTPLVKIAQEQGADYSKLLNTVPFHRMGTAEEVAEAAVWLVSERASYVSGIGMPVDAAWSVACNTD